MVVTHKAPEQGSYWKLKEPDQNGQRRIVVVLSVLADFVAIYEEGGEYEIVDNLEEFYEKYQPSNLYGTNNLLA